MDDKNKCGLEIVCRDGKVECRSICLPYDPSKKCCNYCNELIECNSVCGVVRNRKYDRK